MNCVEIHDQETCSGIGHNDMLITNHGPFGFNNLKQQRYRYHPC